MRRSRILVATTALGMSVVVGGCGNGTEAYCEDLRSAEEQFASFEQGDAAGLEEAVSTFRSLADEAPDEVSGDWETLVGAFEEFEAALNEAGLELSDLEGLSAGEVPEGVDPAELQKNLAPTIEKLDSEEVTQAGDAIEEHAAAECDIQLGE